MQANQNTSGSTTVSTNPGQTQVSPMMSSWTSNTTSSPWGDQQTAQQVSKWPQVVSKDQKNANL